MKLLVVAMSDSIHTARWLAQIADQGFEVHLFPSIDCAEIHPEIRNVTVHRGVYFPRRRHPSVRVCGIPCPSHTGAFFVNYLLQNFFPNHRARALARLVRRLRPDLVHTLELQNAGYLVLDVKTALGGKFPPWILTNWGSDIYLFGRTAAHEPRIRAALASCDFYSCECRRDVCLAKAYGFSGTVLPVFPNTGGFDLPEVARLRQPGPVSERRQIMLKGYQHWAGRALVGLRALERCADLLAGYRIAVYCATPDVALAAELFSRATGITVRLIPSGTSHQEILSEHGRSRISLGLSISDAISTSLLEAMTLGSFPIQSWSACADEWLVDGVTGILVPPDDPEVVERALRRALTDAELVDRAAVLNWELAGQQLDRAVLAGKAADFYAEVLGKRTL